MPLDMNPGIRAQWCAALRSGDYQQGTDRLRTGDSGDAEYCCLGVLTDLYIKAGEPETFTTPDDHEEDVWTWDTILAPVVRKWAGLDSLDPHLTEHTSASQFNDDGTPFAEIADLIDGGAS